MLTSRPIFSASRVWRSQLPLIDLDVDARHVLELREIAEDRPQGLQRAERLDRRRSSQLPELRAELRAQLRAELRGRFGDERRRIGRERADVIADQLAEIPGEQVLGGLRGMASQVRVVDPLPGCLHLAQHLAVADDVLATLVAEPEQRLAVALMRERPREIVFRSRHRALVVFEQQHEANAGLTRRPRLLFRLDLAFGLDSNGLGRRAVALRDSRGPPCRTDLYGGRCRTGDEAQRNHRDEGQPDDTAGDDARAIRSRREILKHRNSPLEMLERSGGACRRARLRPGHAQREQQAAVLARCRVERLDHGGIAGGFTRERVLARRELDEWMEEEQPLGERGHAAQPQVGTLQMRELVAQRHLLLPIGQRAEAIRGKHHDGADQAGDERRLDLTRHAYVRHAPQAQTLAQVGGATLQLGTDGNRRANDRGRFAPAAEGDESEKNQTADPKNQGKNRPLAETAERLHDCLGHARARHEPRRQPRADSGTDPRGDSRKDIGRGNAVLHHWRRAGHHLRRQNLGRQERHRYRCRPRQRQNELGGGAPPQTVRVAGDNDRRRVTSQIAATITAPSIDARRSVDIMMFTVPFGGRRGASPRSVRARGAPRP